MRLTGEYRAKIDAKGRLRIPTDLLDQLGAEDSYTFIVSRGLAKCLSLYPENVWDQKIEELESQLDEFDPEDARIMRAIYGGSKRVETDSSSRVIVPDFLRQYAQIDRDVVLLCMSKKVEIWSLEEYEQDNLMSPEEFARLAKKAATKRKSNE